MNDRTTTRRGLPRRGAVLLEVMFALVLFGTAAAVVGAVLRSALTASVNMRVEIQAMNLAQSVLAELATGEIELADTPATAYDEEDETWTYEIVTETITDSPDLKRVTVIVRNTDPLHARPCRLTQWLVDAPAEEAEGEEYAP